MNCSRPTHLHLEPICMTLLMGSLINLPRSLAISGPVCHSHLMGPQMFSSETTWLCLTKLPVQQNPVTKHQILFQWEGPGYIIFLYPTLSYQTKSCTWMSTAHHIVTNASKHLPLVSVFTLQRISNSLWITVLHGPHFAGLVYAAERPYSKAISQTFSVRDQGVKF